MRHMKLPVRLLGILAALGCWYSCSGDINTTTNPEVVWTIPEGGATNVATTSSITVGFSRVMDPSTITTETFSISDGVSGTVSYSGTTAKFTPSLSLDFNTTYTATITTGVRDKSGIPLKDAQVWSFTTKLPPPIITGFSPDSGGAGTIVNITGLKFSSAAGSNTVRFNRFPTNGSATVLEATPTRVRAVVPFGATTGPITLSTAGGEATSARDFTVIQPGRIWTAATPPTTSSLACVTWTGTQFVAAGATGTVLVSPDGHGWTQKTSGTTSRLNGLAWSGIRVVVVGGGGVVVASLDGNNWVLGSSGTTKSLFSVVWSGSHFVAVGADGRILVSPEGINWTPRDSRTTDWLYDVTSFSFLLAVCGYSGTILTSTITGNSWKKNSSGTAETLLGLAAGPSQLITVGNNGTILTSQTGEIWTPQWSGTTSHLGGVTWGLTPSGVRLVVVGAGGVILTSPDGVEWTKRDSPTTVDLNDVAWSGVKFVAVGENGAILTSE